MVQVRIIIKRSFPFGVFAVNPPWDFSAKIHIWLFFADPFETFKSESEKPKWAMNLSASVACITNNYNRRLNIYSVNQNATSYNVKRKRRSKRKGSLESSTSTSRSSSISSPCAYRPNSTLRNLISRLSLWPSPLTKVAWISTLATFRRRPRCRLAGHQHIRGLSGSLPRVPNGLFVHYWRLGGQHQ